MTTPRGPSSSTAIQQVRTLLVYIYLYCNLHESWQLTIVNEVRLVARGGALQCLSAARSGAGGRERIHRACYYCCIY